MALSKEQILAVDDLKRELVEVPEWGGQVYVRVLTGTERDSFESETVSTDGAVDRRDFRAKLCARTICDEAGAAIFGGGDVAILGKKSASALDRVFQVALRINGLSKEEVDAIAKN